MVFKTAFSFIGKILSYKKGSLALLSLVAAGGVTEFLNMLTKGTNEKNLWIPVVVQFSGFIIFMFFSFVDMTTGIQAAKYRHQKLKREGTHIKSYKLWRTLWKALGVMILSTMIMLLGVFAEIIASKYAWWIAIWALVGFWVMANGFEFHSIGENLQKRHGTKPPIFGFWEKVLGAVQNKIINKIDDSFDILENDDREDDTNNINNDNQGA